MPSWLTGLNGLDLFIILGTAASVLIVGEAAVRAWREGAAQD